MRVAGELSRCDASISHTLGVGGLRAGDMLSFHLQRAIGIGWLTVEQVTSQTRFIHGIAGPEVRCEESDWPFEVASVQKERPTLIAVGMSWPLVLALGRVSGSGR